MSGRHQFVEARQNVVPRHDANTDLAAYAVPGRRVEQRLGARHRIHAAGIGDHFHAAFGDGRKHTLHRADEVPRVPHARIAFLLLLQNRHRDFGEVVKHEIIDLTTFHLTARRFQPIAPESLTAGDAHHAR